MKAVLKSGKGLLKALFMTVLSAEPSAKFMVVSAEQPEKAFSFIVVIPLPILTVTKAGLE